MRQNRGRALVRVAKYGSVDAVLFPFNISIATGLDFIGVNSAAATAAGFFFQITIAFFVNRRWTFHSSLDARHGLVRTWLIGISDLVVAVLATQVIQSELALTYFWARLWGSLFVFAWDYTANSVITFKTAFWR